METPVFNASVKVDQPFSGNVELPPKKRGLDREMEVCNEPPEIENIQPNSTSVKPPKTTIGGLAQAQIVGSQELKSQKADPQSEDAFEKDESEAIEIDNLETNSTSPELPKTIVGGLDKGKEVCNESFEIDDLETNSNSHELPKITVGVLDKGKEVCKEASESNNLQRISTSTDPPKITVGVFNEPMEIDNLETNLISSNSPKFTIGDLHKGKQVCNVPLEIDSLLANSEYTEPPKLNIGVLDKGKEFCNETPEIYSLETKLFAPEPQRFTICVLDKGKEVCDEPMEMNSLETNLISLEPPKTLFGILDKGKEVCNEPMEINSLQANYLFSSDPPKFTIGASDKGKEVCNETTEIDVLETNVISSEPPKFTIGVSQQAQSIDSQESRKAVPKSEDESESSLCVNLLESSEPRALIQIPSNDPPSRPGLPCKFCNQVFPTTQALGGHQNAHKKEREEQKALKEAEDYETNPFLFGLPGTLAPAPRLSLNLIHPYAGHSYQYHPYNGYNSQRSFQTRPAYSPPEIGFNRGFPGFGRGLLGRFLGSAPVNPVDTTIDHRWSTAMPCASSIGPIRRSNRLPNFNPYARSNLTSFMQASESMASLTKQQQTVSSSIDLSHLHREAEMADLASRWGESSNRGSATEIDLTLRL